MKYEKLVTRTFKPALNNSFAPASMKRIEYDLRRRWASRIRRGCRVFPPSDPVSMAVSAIEPSDPLSQITQTIERLKSAFPWLVELGLAKP